jgi:hypothetical protein
MLDAIHQHQLTRLLKGYSERLDELIIEARRHGSQSLPPELIDMIASTVGELMLALVDHQTAYRTAESTSKAVSDAQRLREDVRSRGLECGQVAEAVATLARKVDLIIREDQRAA